MTDHYHGIPETGVAAGRLFPAETLWPGESLTPTADWFGPWRVPLWTVHLIYPAASGATAVAVAGWARWDYRRGVNPAVEAAPLLDTGEAFRIDGETYTTTAPVWAPDACGGRTALIFDPPLSRNHGTDSAVWIPVERMVGAVRLAREGQFTTERLEATLCTLADGLNLMAGRVVVTYEGAIPTFAGVWDASEGILASALYVEMRTGLLAPALMPDPATLARPGLVYQAEFVGDVSAHPTSTQELWPALDALETGLATADCLVEAPDAG